MFVLFILALNINLSEIIIVIIFRMYNIAFIYSSELKRYMALKFFND